MISVVGKVFLASTKSTFPTTEDPSSSNENSLLFIWFTSKGFTSLLRETKLAGHLSNRLNTLFGPVEYLTSLRWSPMSHAHF
jgi:hypothetical protein